MEDVRLKRRLQGVCQQAVSEPGLRIGLLGIGERKDVGRVEEVDERMRVARGLREAMVEAAAAAAGDVRHHAIEDLAMHFVFVEAVIEIGAEETAALRDAERDAALDGSARQAELRSAAVLDLRDRVAHRRRAHAYERRILRTVD